MYDYFWGTSRDFVIYGEDIYFNYMGDYDSIWMTGSDNIKLNNEPSYNINVYRDNIYYTNSSNNICSISTKGGKGTIIGNDKSDFIIVDEGWIYYSNINDGNKLYKMKLDGTNVIKLSDVSVPGFNIVGNLVIYFHSGQMSYIMK